MGFRVIHRKHNRYWWINLNTLLNICFLNVWKKPKIFDVDHKKILLNSLFILPTKIHSFIHGTIFSYLRFPFLQHYTSCKFTTFPVSSLYLTSSVCLREICITFNVNLVAELVQVDFKLVWFHKLFGWY